MNDNDWTQEHQKQEVKDFWFQKSMDKMKNTPPWVDKFWDYLSLAFLASLVIFFIVFIMKITLVMIGSML